MVFCVVSLSKLNFISMKYKGQLRGFPEEVVEKMLYYQEQQGNERDVAIFEDRNEEERKFGGFDWIETPEGSVFWYRVIEERNFDLFFEKYPSKHLKRGDWVYASDLG